MKAGELQAAVDAALETTKVELERKIDDAGMIARTYRGTIQEMAADIIPIVIQDALQAAEAWRLADARTAKAAASKPKV